MYITLDFDFYQYFIYNSSMEKIYTLLDQIIEKNIWEDNMSKDKDATGDNWDVYHLKLLRTLLEQYEKEKSS